MPTIALEMERLRNPYSGLGQYCLQLGRAFATEGSVERLGFVCLVPAAFVGEFGDRMQYKVVKPWHKLLGPSFGESLWHCMHQDSEFLPRSRKTLLAMTIHDLNFLDRPDYSAAKKSRRLGAMQQKINRSKGLVYISDFVQKKVREHLKVPVGTVEQVIYNGGGVEPQELRGKLPTVSSQLQKIKDLGPFLFSIGIHPKKNYHILLPILAEFKEYQWVIAGPDSRGYQARIEAEAVKYGVSNRVIFCGPVDDVLKVEYYQHCKALLFPSLSEGFGLPVVEAMSLGKPVFLSDLTSLPEIGGEEAYYFRDFEPQTLIETFGSGMKDFASDPDKPVRMQQWATRFSWKKAADQYLEFYHKLLINNN